MDTSAILEQSTSASIIIWVVMMIALSGVAKDLTKLQISCLVDGSSPVVGSSRLTTEGDPIRLTAIDSLRLMPPESCPDGRMYTSGAPNPTAVAISRAAN